MAKFEYEIIANIAKGSNSSKKEVLKVFLDSPNYNEIAHKKNIEEAAKSLFGPTARLVGGILGKKKL